MATISTAIGTERLSRVSGYKIKKGFFSNVTPNLPQVIAVFGEANTANQSGLSLTKREVTSAQEAAEIYGYGSPIHLQMRILRPTNGDGVGGIPTIVFPQAEAENAFPASRTWTVLGTATENATHIVVVNGRRGIDFQNYNFSVVKGDTANAIAEKMADAVNGVLSSPVIATVVTDGVIQFEAKWAGASSDSLNISVDNNQKDAGVTYAETGIDTGLGEPDLAPSLSQFGSDWITIVLNPYASENSTQTLSTLEQFNGFPDPTSPTGRYSATVFKPFVALYGQTISDKNDLADLSEDSINQVTNVICPAPNSDGFPFEAAANVGALLARVAQDTPELDVNALSYPDMPIPNDNLIGDMAEYNNRDFLVKRGVSTVILENGAYQIQDLVTTYHPAGENPLQYSYVRNLFVDFNIKDGYDILERLNVKDKVLVEDAQVTDSKNSVKPKQWKAVVFDYFDDLAIAALIREPQFSKDSLQVQVNEINPNRFDTFFRYKRTGIARIESTDVEAGF